MSYNSALTDTQIRATPLPVSGTVTVTPSGTQTVAGTVTANAGSGTFAVSGPLTDTQLRATALPVSLASTTVTGTVTVSLASTTITGSVAVTGPLTDTQIRATALPVSLTSTTITGSVAVAGPLTDTQLRAAVVPVSLASTTITGTAAISAASLPLPTGAATETTLAALNTKVTAVNTGAVTISAALPTGTNAIGSVTRVDTTASGTITAISQNVALALNGKSGATIQITGTWVGALQLDGTVDGTNWSAINGVLAGSSTPGSTITANGIVRLTPSGLAQFRITSTAWTSGTATISLRASDAAGGTFLNQSLTAGTNIIGKVGIDQTTPGTTNLVSVAGVAQSSTTSGQTGNLTLGAVTTAPPSYTTGQTSPLSMTVQGGLRVTVGNGGSDVLVFNTGSDALATSQTVLHAAALGYVYNGTSWDRARGDTTSGMWVNVKAALPTGANVIGALTANQSVNVSQMNGVAVAMGSGVTGTGVQRVVLATDVALPAAAAPAATYSATIVGLATAVTATDVFTITGSASKTIRVSKILINGVQTTAAQINVLIIKRSTANSAGTSTAPTRVPYDSASAAATATVLAYTANPTTGTAVGTGSAIRVFVPGAATASDAQGLVVVSGDVGQQMMTLRGIAEVLAVNLNSTTVAGSAFNITVEWTET